MIENFCQGLNTERKWKASCALQEEKRATVISTTINSRYTGKNKETVLSKKVIAKRANPRENGTGSRRARLEFRKQLTGIFLEVLFQKCSSPVRDHDGRNSNKILNFSIRNSSSDSSHLEAFRAV